MKVYSDIEEENVKAQKSVRDWSKSDFIDLTQANQFESEVDSGLARTKTWLRVAQFIFTFGAGLAFIGLLSVAFRFRLTSSMGWLVLSGLACVIAEYVIQRAKRKLYRYGIEEAILALAVISLGIGCSGLFRSLLVSGHSYYGYKYVVSGVSMALAIACVAVYVRYGYRYAVAIAMVFLAWSVHRWPGAKTLHLIVVSAVFCLFIVILEALRRKRLYEYREDDYRLFQAMLVLGIYLQLNLRLRLEIFSFRHVRVLEGMLGYSASFYWLTYALCFLIPALALAIAIYRKDRMLLFVGIGTGLITLVTNKAYLGLARHAWDPMVLGVFLVGAAIGVKRWLSTGVGRMRYGFTADRMSAASKAYIGMLGTASVLLGGGPKGGGASESPDFGGGRSGGGGAQGSF